MEQTLDSHKQSLRVAAPTNPRIRRQLLILGSALIFGGVIVWQLREEWAKDALWLWLLLLVAMFVSARALQGLELWLPGEPELPRLAAFPARRRRVLDAACIVAALALTGILIWRLWPDYHKWQVTPLLWLAAVAIAVIGAWLVGAVGRGSPRAATALMLWHGTRGNVWLEVAAFTLILALAILLRTYRLDSIPRGIYVDETNGALDALHILKGRPDSPFGTGWYGTPSGYFYYMVGIFQLLGCMNAEGF